MCQKCSLDNIARCAVGNLRRKTMPKDNYPLHPGQTHAEPYYCTIPLEEYESIMRENKRLKDVLKRHGITLLKEANNG